MKNKLSFSILLIFSLALAASCKKYEENPLINLRSKEFRLTRGDYYRTAGFWVNDVDSMSNIFYRGPIGFSEVNGRNEITGGFIGGTWDFVDHKKFLRIDATSDPVNGVGPFLTESSLDWRITKLTDRELHLKIDYRGKHYVLHLHEVKI